MIEIRIPKEITEYTEKPFLGLSWRKLGFTVLALICGGGTGIFLYVVCGLTTDSALIPGMIVSVPFWALGFLKPLGLNFEEAAVYYIQHIFGNNKLPYVTELEQFAVDENFPVSIHSTSKEDRKNNAKALSKEDRKELKSQSECSTGRLAR